MQTMFKKTLVLLLIIFLTSSSLFALGAEHKKLGTGVSIGEPIGYSSRFFLMDQLSLDLVFGYGFAEEALVIMPTVSFHLRRILDYDGEKFSLVPYFGGGLKTGIDLGGRNDGEGLVGMRFPLGASLVVADGAFEIGAELAPGAEFSPDSGFDLTGGISLRYYFF